jgi:leader peptidase (prepilin peptidase) / N-methyltransferase
MDALAVALVAVLGALVGSFLNVVVYRVPRGESVVSPGSRCPRCHAAIRPWDNVPVLSWLALRGRCRNCGASISARYPLVEALTAVVFAAVALARGVDGGLALELPFAAMLIAVAAIDLEHRIVPNRIVVPMALYAVAGAAIVYPGQLPELLAAGAGAFLALLIAALAKPAGMGMGDVKLAGTMGLYLGVSVIPALFAAFLIGAVVGIALALRQGGGVRGKGIPFAPFLALGGLVGLLAGPQLVDLYVDRLG